MCAQAMSQATPVVKDAADTVAPYVKAGLQTASDVAAPALKAAEPVVQARLTFPVFLEDEVPGDSIKKVLEVSCTPVQAAGCLIQGYAFSICVEA